MSDELARLDATAQADLVRRGEMKPLELVDAAIARLERLDPELSAVISPQLERARDAADAADLPQGPFRGVPFLLKDLGAHLDGDPTYNGMAILKRLDWRAKGESYFAGALREAGLISLGRTNAPELGLLPTTEPDCFAPSRNPWKLSHSPGGSSGGSAAAVAAGIVPVAHATDGGGSIRIPASHCGLVGLKPSRGRNSFGPDLGQRWGGLSCEGFVTRSVRDTAALIDLVAGPRPGDPYTTLKASRPYAEEIGADPGALRIGLLTRPPRGGDSHPDCVAAASEAAKLLASLGHRVEESHPAALEDPAAVKGFLTMVSSGVAQALDAWSEKIGHEIGKEDVEPLTWQVATTGRGLSAKDYVAAENFNHAHARRIASWYHDDGFDLLLTPTSAAPPPPLGHFAPTAENPGAGFVKAIPFSAFTSVFNVTGQPSISLPLHWSEEGLPIGVQLTAPTGREDVLIRIAAQIEQAAPWADRTPPTHA
jgi:amidase